MKINTTNKLYWIYLGGFLAIVALPLVNLPPWFSPPDWGKTILLRIIVSSLLLLFVSQLLFFKEGIALWAGVKDTFQKGLKKIPAFWLFLALGGTFFLATIFSQDQQFSLWGDPARSGGFVNFAFSMLFILLLLFILRKEHWKALWMFTFLIGILVALIAVFQQFEIFSSILLGVAGQISSTLGGPWTLGIYLLLLGFTALGFGCVARRPLEKFFFFGSFFLFGFVVLLTISQAAYAGFAIGFLWFVFLFPKKLVLLKFFFGLFLALGVLGAFFLKTHPDIPLSRHDVVSALTSWGIPQDRVSAWKVSWEALKGKPLFGYGPENFSIAFDKYYDPSLPGIEKMPTYSVTSWWDRAHNILFDISVQAGIPTLLIYLGLFLCLLWQLQRYKQKIPEKAPLAHSMQAALVGYLGANIFSFDTFSTYLVSFLLVGYSLHLISSDALEHSADSPAQKPLKKAFPWKIPAFVVISILFVWFIWQYNIKPFRINTQINIAKYLVEHKAECKLGLESMEEVLSRGRSVLDSYAIIEYVNLLRKCDASHPKNRVGLAQKGYDLLKENIEIRPSYTRKWIFLGGFANILLEAEQQKPAELQSKGKIEQLKKEAQAYFQKAHELSPKRQEVYIEWIKNDLLSGEYQKAKERAQECIWLNPKLGSCWWLLARAELSLGNTEQGQKAIRQAAQRLYLTTSQESLLQLAKVALAHKEAGRFESARATALLILALDPNAKKEVEDFLKSLP